MDERREIEVDDAEATFVRGSQRPCQRIQVNEVVPFMPLTPELHLTLFYEGLFSVETS